MELRQLISFVAVADTGSMSNAAIRCHITQGAISHHIKSLEDEFDTVLIDRRMFSEIYDSTFFSTDSTFIEIELNKRRTDSTCPGNDSIFSGKDSTFPGMAFNYFSW